MHRQQVRHRCKRCAKAGQKAHDLRSLKSRYEQALGVVWKPILATTERDNNEQGNREC